MPPTPATVPAAIAHTGLPDPRLLRARQRAAEHRAAEALARWRSGIEPQDHPEPDPAMQAQLRWHRQLQDAYVAWLQAGGFAQGS
jgi:hypothetical protein